jgi:hypothetical protein
MMNASLDSFFSGSKRYLRLTPKWQRTFLIKQEEGPDRSLIV